MKKSRQTSQNLITTVAAPRFTRTQETKRDLSGNIRTLQERVRKLQCVPAADTPTLH